MLNLTLYLIGFVASITLIIQIFKILLKRNEKLAQTEGSILNAIQKKNPIVDINSYESLLLNLSLIVVLTVLIGAFEWKTYDEAVIKDLGTLTSTEIEVIDIPVTEQIPPPPPKVLVPEIIEVADVEEVQNDIKVEFSSEMDEKSTVEQVVVEAKVEQVVIKEEKIEEIFTVVEEPATPYGGMPAFYAEMGAIVRYPEAARQSNVEGKVYVEFVVNKEGKLTEIKAVKGIGFGCDEEAVRIIKQAKAWKPAKQRGKEVLQRMIIPIIFKMNVK